MIEDVYVSMNDDADEKRSESPGDKISLIADRNQNDITLNRARLNTLEKTIRALPGILRKRKFALYLFRGTMLLVGIGVGAYWILKNQTYNECGEQVDVDFSNQRANLTNALRFVEALSHRLYREKDNIHYYYYDSCGFSIQRSSLCNPESCPTHFHSWEYDRLCTNSTSVYMALEQIKKTYCFNVVDHYCEDYTSMMSVMYELDIAKQIANQIKISLTTALDYAYLLCNQDYLSPFQNSALLYFVLLGLGEISPAVLLLLTLFSKIVTYGFSKVPGLALEGLSREELQSNPNGASELDCYQSAYDVTAKKLYPHNCRLSFFMSSHKREDASPAALIFKDPLREAKLASMIFGYVGNNEPSKDEVKLSTTEAKRTSHNLN